MTGGTVPPEDRFHTPRPEKPEMKIHDQRDRLIDAVREIEAELHGMRCAVLRKMAASYGDGSRSDMVNGSTDVLPRLQAIIDRLTAATDAVC